MKTKLVKAFLISAISAIAAGYAIGQAGSIDTTFGSGGKVLMQVHDSIPVYPEGMAVQSDGKIVAVVGYDTEHLLRLNPDGSPDPTFGVSGRVTFSWSNSYGYGNVQALALQNIADQERIVVAGYSYIRSGRSNIAILHVERFMPDGSVDTSFGVQGHAIYNTGYATDIAIHPDGKILTVGSDQLKLVRLNVDGALDTSFGSGGVVNTSGLSSSSAVAADLTGGILVGGTVTVGKGNNARRIMAVKRYNSVGELDTGFGTSGTAKADFSGSSSVQNLEVDVAGNIVISGSSSGPAIARFTAQGQPDTSFNGTGRTSSTGISSNARGLVIQPDGKLVVTGSANQDFSLVRFNVDGSLDSTFGNNGAVQLDVYGADYSNVSTLQFDPACQCPKIIMSGGAAPITSFARFNIF